MELSEWPNELTAGVILPIADKQCQRYFYEIENTESQHGKTGGQASILDR